jgi:hypothetical protein
MPDGKLVKVTEHTWQGTLSGYEVHVSSVPEWFVAIIHPGRYTVLCRSAPDLADAQSCAAYARQWIEEHPLPPR